MSESNANTASSSLAASRWVLIGAGAIALATVGYTLFRSVSGVDPAAPAAKVQPEVGSSISSLEARLKDNPNDAEGWRMLAWSLFETGKFAESAQAYKRAAQIEPGKAEYWSSLGEALVLAGKGDVPPDAKAAFARAFALDPKDPRARYFLGVAKDIAGDHKGAVDDWLSLLEDTPPGAPWEADVRRLVGEVAAKEKISIAGRLSAIKPPPASSGAGIATAAIPGPSPQQMRDAAGMPKGQQDLMIQGMVESLEAKLKANPDNPSGWIMLMRSRLQLGETVKASAALKSARAAFASDQKKRGMVDAAAAELGVR